MQPNCSSPQTIAKTIKAIRDNVPISGDFGTDIIDLTYFPVRMTGVAVGLADGAMYVKLLTELNFNK